MSKLAQNITTLRGSLTQAEFGKLFGVGDQTVSNWEKDRRTPPIEKLIKMAQMFDVSLDWLITGKETKDKEVIARKDAAIDELTEKYGKLSLNYAKVSKALEKYGDKLNNQK